MTTVNQITRHLGARVTLELKNGECYTGTLTRVGRTQTTLEEPLCHVPTWSIASVVPAEETKP